MRTWVLLVTIIFGAGFNATRASASICADETPADPVTVGETGIYRDGGTLFVVFTDAKGCAYQISLDRRMAGGTQCLYVNAKHPTHEGAKQLDTGGELAAGIADSLERWLRSQYDGPAWESLSADGARLSDEEARGVGVWEMVRTIRSQPCLEVNRGSE